MRDNLREESLDGRTVAPGDSATGLVFVEGTGRTRIHLAYVE